MGIGKGILEADYSRKIAESVSSEQLINIATAKEVAKTRYVLDEDKPKIEPVNFVKHINKYDKQTNSFCNVCGGHNHESKFCKYKTYICKCCKQRGPLVKMCKKKANNSNDVRKDLGKYFNVNKFKKEIISFVTECAITFEIDMGSNCSLIPYASTVNIFRI